MTLKNGFVSVSAEKPIVPLCFVAEDEPEGAALGEVAAVPAGGRLASPQLVSPTSRASKPQIDRERVMFVFFRGKVLRTIQAGNSAV